MRLPEEGSSGTLTRGRSAIPGASVRPQEERTVAETRYLSVAVIAKMLDMPESTLHYWKNRFSEHLPGTGQGRSRRFAPQAVEAFRTVGRLLKAGHSVESIRQELAQQSPQDSAEQDAAGPVLSRSAQSPEQEGAHPLEPRLLAALEANGQAQEVRLGVLEANGQTLEAKFEVLEAKSQTLEAKLGVLEAELVRLRKDGRERDKQIEEKLKRMQR